MKAYVIVIGDEILLGRVTDTNSGDIARSLDPLGIPVSGVEVVGDDAGSITAAVRRAISAADIVITTGGLGPTKDDITKAALMEVFGGTLRRDPEVTANIHRIFAAKGRPVNALTEDQALVPDTCTVIQNVYGTAPLMMWERDGHILVAMPGVPSETRGMLSKAVIPMIRNRYHAGKTLTHNTLIVTGITESALAATVRPSIEKKELLISLAALLAVSRTFCAIVAVVTGIPDIRSFCSAVCAGGIIIQAIMYARMHGHTVVSNASATAQRRTVVTLQSLYLARPERTPPKTLSSRSR